MLRRSEVEADRQSVRARVPYLKIGEPPHYPRGGAVRRLSIDETHTHGRGLGIRTGGTDAWMRGRDLNPRDTAYETVLGTELQSPRNNYGHPGKRWPYQPVQRDDWELEVRTHDPDIHKRCIPFRECANNHVVSLQPRVSATAS